MLLGRRMRVVREALVVEVVDESGDSPALLVLTELLRVGPHRAFHRQHVPLQRFALCVFVHEGKRVRSRRNFIRGHRFPGGFGVGVSPILPKSMKPFFGFVERSSTSISSPTSTPRPPRTSIPSTGGFITRTNVPLGFLPVTLAVKRWPIRSLKRIAAAILRTVLSTLRAASSLSVQLRAMAVSSSSLYGGGSFESTAFRRR